MRSVSLFVLMVLPLTLPSASQEVPPSGAALRERFLARVDEPLVQYRGVRRLAARNERFHKEARLDVATMLDASGGFRYEVLAESGSQYVRTRVLEPILRGEARAVGEGATARAALTTANYEFVSAEPDGEPLARLLIRPRRKDALLVEGAILVTPDDADLVRIEGRLARNPSFWTSRVEVRREYARIGGVRVPVRVESRAWVKVAGLSSFVMTYEYEEINGRALAPSSAAR
ncbi:MAG: hypothetical protein ACRD1S_10300 [Vicinamibacterales bacterium]